MRSDRSPRVRSMTGAQFAAIVLVKGAWRPGDVVVITDAVPIVARILVRNGAGVLSWQDEPLAAAAAAAAAAAVADNKAVAAQGAAAVADGKAVAAGIIAAAALPKTCTATPSTGGVGSKLAYLDVTVHDNAGVMNEAAEVEVCLEADGGTTCTPTIDPGSPATAALCWSDGGGTSAPAAALLQRCIYHVALPGGGVGAGIRLILTCSASAVNVQVRIFSKGSLIASTVAISG